MKIQDIEALYAEKGPDGVEQDYRDLVDTFCRLESKEPIPNSDYLHGLYLTDLMLRTTNSSIRILSGIGESNWLGVLRDSLFKALTRIKAKGNCLKAIFVGQGNLPESIVMIRSDFGDETVKVMTAKPSQPVEHLIACDSRMLRLEKIHAPITPQTDSSEIIASVYLNNPARTRTKEEEFDYIWDYLEKKQ
jgi:hypothetical protein